MPRIKGKQPIVLPPHIESSEETQDTRREHREVSQTRPFVAWDGEAVTDSDGIHQYNLFGNSNGDTVRGESLTYRECFPLLVNSVNVINVIFSGHYDIIMMTREWPIEQIERLLDGKVVKYGGYRCHYRKRKWIDIKQLETGKSARLYDVISFFQTSFVKACVEYLGDDETLQEIARMKSLRDSFTYGDETVEAYWRSENEYLVKLMTKLRELLAEVGIKPSYWYGPGAVAAALLQQHQMKQYYPRNLSDELVDIAERAYYGGRFEHFQVGKMEDVYEYDIRSAYPNAITRLPDMSHMTWEHLDGSVGIHPFALFKVSWDIPVRKYPYALGPFPWRDKKGGICFPLKGTESWYWGIELAAAFVVYDRKYFTIHETWWPKGSLRKDYTFPFLWVQDMYDERARMKREGNPAQMALKLGMNSLYGKLAQSVGAKHKPDGTWIKPGWHNIMWAGWITAYTRSKLLVSTQSPRAHKHIVAIETDAIFSRVPIKFPLTDELGAWEETKLDEVLYVHSGIYYAFRDGKWTAKTRGIEADKSKTVFDWLEVFTHLPHEKIIVTNKLRRFGTDIRQPKRYGTWYDYEISFVLPNALSKRVHAAKICQACIFGHGNYAMTAHWLHVPEQSHHRFITADCEPSTPYAFPWRTDVEFQWPEHVHSELLDPVEDTDIEWEMR